MLNNCEDLGNYFGVKSFRVTFAIENLEEKWKKKSSKKQQICFWNLVSRVLRWMILPVKCVFIKKQFIKTKPVCKVTFTVEAKEANNAAVVGDFNNWNPKEGELSKLKNGTFKGVFDVNKDASYEFKYVIDGAFVNEVEADSYRFNEFAGAENSVLEV